jgi:UDP-N-acetylmuramoyl-L-alanine---L-glutamate ligase
MHRFAMRHGISFSDLAGQRVGVFGVGVEGRAATTRLLALGCDLVLVDDDRAATGEPGVLATHEGGERALRTCVAVVKSPGISRYREDVAGIERAGVPVLGGVGMWLEEADRSRVICVTGTKGKSTVTTVTGHLARGLGTDAVVAGNLGVPPFDPALELDGRLVVVETSSFQATDVFHSPHVVAVTSLGDDHVDWHGTAERYHADKLSLTRQRGARHTVVADTATLRAHREQLGGEVTMVTAEDRELADALGLPGRHGASNAAVAAAALRAAGVEGSDDHDKLVKAAQGLEPLPGRFREIARHGGVRFVDDSLATNPLPTIAALEAVGDERVALLVGGHDRGVDYDELVAAICTRPGETLLVTLPDNGPSIGQRVAARSSVRVLDAGDVAGAVALAVEWLDGTGIVLLSPAAPSFSQFRSWAERSVRVRRGGRVPVASDVADLPPTLVLVHSPLVGPGTWRAAAGRLEHEGWSCTLPDLTDSLRAGPPYAARQLASILKTARDRGSVVVGHSGAGPLVAQAAGAAEAIAGCVLVDATLPTPGRSWRESAPAPLCARLDELARDGWVPPWPQWWGPGELEALVVDPELRAAFVADCPELPLAMLDEPQPAGVAWRDASGAYLQLSAAYDGEADAARSLGWPVLERPGHHLEVLTDPARVVDGLLELVSAIVR